MKKLITLLSVMAVLSSTVVFAGTFTDVDENQMYFDGIEFLATEGVISGNPDGSFAPERTLNRAELLKILVEATTKPAVFEAFANQNCFTDVASGEWYTQYVCYAKAQGWVVGYENGKFFRPAQAVNFVEALKMTLEAFEIEYPEDSEVWYRGIVETASESNYIPFDIIAFDGALRRDQMGDMVTRIIRDERGELEEYLGERAALQVTYDTILERHDVSEDAPKITRSNAQTLVVKISIDAFTPADLSIHKGDTIRFLNSDVAPHWPASKNYPTHAQYEVGDVDKCDVAPAGVLFDSCKGLFPGEYFDFTFEEVGTWNYFDNIGSSQTGSITVVE